MKTDGYRCKSQAEFSPETQSYSLSEARYKHALYGYLTNELNVVVVFFLFLNKESGFAQEHTFLKNVTNFFLRNSQMKCCASES